MRTGKIKDPESDACGRSIRGRMLCFPYGKGSTVGSYAMYQLKLNGKAPRAIVNSTAEPIVATGAIMSGTPMVDRVDTGIIRDGDRLAVDGTEGTVELKGVEERRVVTGILERRGKILILQRSGEVGSFRGLWAGVSGYIEPGETDLEAARREIAEELGLKRPRLLRRTGPRSFRSGDVVWTVHAFLFAPGTGTVSTDWEHERHSWISPDELVGYDTVPGLEKIVGELLGRPIP